MRARTARQTTHLNYTIIVTKPRILILVDGANIFYTQKLLGWRIDWLKLINKLSKHYFVAKMRYYTGIHQNDHKMEKYLNSLKHIGFTVKTKPLKLIKTSKGELFYKANCDVEMAVDAILEKDFYQYLVLISGDSDFLYLIHKLQNKFKKKIILYSSRKTISWEIKLATNKYFYFEDLKNELIKTPAKKRGSVIH